MKVNILVCVKQVPKEEDLKLDPVTKTLIRSQGTGVISEYDKYAMELAARLKAEDGGKVTAVTMGPPSSMEVLRYCIAVGADDVYLLSDRALGGADAYATVNALAAAKAYLEAGGTKYDLVLCGKQASDSDTSLVMPELAECLGLPQVTFVSGYELSEGKLIVQRETDEGTDHIELLKANHMEIPILDAQALGLEAEEIGVKGSRTTVGSSYFPEHNKSCVTVSGESGEEIAGNLLSALRSARMI